MDRDKQENGRIQDMEREFDNSWNTKSNDDDSYDNDNEDMF